MSVRASECGEEQAVASHIDQIKRPLRFVYALRQLHLFKCIQNICGVSSAS